MRNLNSIRFYHKVLKQLSNIDFLSNHPKSFLTEIAMVGANCSIFGCSSSLRKPGVAILKVPQGHDEWSSNWSKSIVSVVTKD